MRILGKKKEEKKLEKQIKELKEPEELPKEEEEQESKGNFSLTEAEMTLAVNTLASSEEFKLYQQMVLGEEIAEIIQGYNAAIQKKQEEEGLPKKNE